MADPATIAANRERGWWVDQIQQLQGGLWDVRVQFLDGHALQLQLEPTRNLDLVIAAAVDAHLRADRRWTRRSDRGRR